MRPQGAISILARTNHREPHRLVGIKQADRLAHMYIVGKTGTGKSTLLETLIRQDLIAGRGCALLDPHGDLVERVQAGLPPNRRADTVYLDAPDPAQPFGYNPLLHVSPHLRPLVASGLIDVLKKMWDEAWGVRMEHILRNTLLALLDQPRATVADILPMLSSKSFRAKALTNVENEQVLRFWREEFPQYSYRYQADGIAPIQNKVGAFLADPKLRRILMPDDGGIRLREIMDNGKVLLVNLSVGKLGTDSSSLLGGLLVTALGSAAFSRAFLPASKRRPFFIYVDEFQTMATLAFVSMLSELRAFGAGLVLAHQYLDQLDRDVLEAVLGNVGTIVSFRLGAADAETIGKEFEPLFEPGDFTRLPNFDVYLKLLVDGAPAAPFSATAVRPSRLPVA